MAKLSKGDRYTNTSGTLVGGLIAPGAVVVIRDTDQNIPGAPPIVVDVPPDAEGEAGHPSTVGQAVALTAAQLAEWFTEGEA
jgi:hypothetical protein